MQSGNGCDAFIVVLFSLQQGTWEHLLVVKNENKIKIAEIVLDIFH